LRGHRDFFGRTIAELRAKPELRSWSVEATAVIKSLAANESFQPILADVHFSSASGRQTAVHLSGCGE